MTGSTVCKAILPLLALGVLASCDSPSADPTGLSIAKEPPVAIAPLLTRATPIRDRYIVVFKRDVSNPAAMAQQMVSAHRGRLHFAYHSALKGFAATLTPAAVDELRRNPSVSYVEQDGTAYPTTDETGAPWNLDRIDQRGLVSDGVYSYTKTGAGVHVYIIDTGINFTHVEIAGRAFFGADFVGDGQNGRDCNGHGTHVSGTVAGTTYGVAKAATVVAVRVFGCTGGAAFSTIIAGVDWVTAHAVRPAVANMSLGGDFDAATNAAVANSVASGVVYAVAAGNDAADACVSSPSSEPSAITVGAMDEHDVRASFSNTGPCVDIFAPGVDIVSGWWTSNTALAIASGTSMSSPHVAGVAALYMQGGNPSVATVTNAIMKSATLNALSSLGDFSPNALLFSPLTASPTVFAMNPSSLSFTFVRTGSATASPASLGPMATPKFVAAAGARTKAGTSATPGTVYVATTATALSANISLKNVSTPLTDWSASTDMSWASVTPESGALGGGSSTWLTASVDGTSLTLGTHAATLTLKQIGNSHNTQIPISVKVMTAADLPLGVVKKNIALASGGFAYYQVVVPPLSTNLKIAISGGTGDADLYVAYEKVPTLSSYDCRPFITGSSESCSVTLPAAGTYYVMLHPFSGSVSGLSVSATVGGVPLAPMNLVGTVKSASRIDLKWGDGSSNETAFNLYRRKKASNGTWGPWAATKTFAKNVTAFSNTGLVGSSTYQYRIRACNSEGCSDYAMSSAATTE